MGLLFSKIWSLFSAEEHKIVIVGLDNAGKTTILYQFLMNEVVHTSPTIGSNVEEVVWKNIHFIMWDLGGQQSLRAAWSTYYSNTEANTYLFVQPLNERVRYMCLSHASYWNVVNYSVTSHLSSDTLFHTSPSDVYMTTYYDLHRLQKFSGEGTPTYCYYFPLFQFVILVIDSTDRERLSVTREELYKMLNHEELANAAVLIYANKQDVKDCMSAAEISRHLDLTAIKNQQWHIQSCCALTGEGLYQGLEWICSHLRRK